MLVQFKSSYSSLGHGMPGKDMLDQVWPG